MSRSFARHGIESAFKNVGFSVFSAIGQGAIEALARVSDPYLTDRYGLLSSPGAVVVAFPYDPRPIDDSAAASFDTVDPPCLSVGAFAAFNRYATMTRLLLQAGRALADESGLPYKGFRAIVNSRLPEKRLATVAGLGFIGLSSLVVTEAYGPACLLGALLLHHDYPIDDDSSEISEATPVPGGGCGTCRACVDACPTGAIRSADGERAGVDLDLCIQHWTTKPGDVPAVVRAAWGNRLYGCDDCVAACPRSVGAWARAADGQSPAERADTLIGPDERRPGRRVPASIIGTGSDDEIRAYFRKTALGMSWITPEALRRNHRLATAAPSYFRSTI